MATKRKTAGRGVTKRPSEGDAGGQGEPTERGTAAGMRAGARSKSEAKAMTSPDGKKSQKELTKRGGPGHAGTNQKRASAGGEGGRAGTSASVESADGEARKRKPTRSRGTKARAGA
ncbi:MAG TPA: hypothetical protein VFS43_10590 [Polyangiaceae bacterium]|nr:hypothetical protein [Polyangiaceae bacterium]